MTAHTSTHRSDGVSKEIRFVLPFRIMSSRFLMRLIVAGIRYVTTGHQPHGDAPLVLTTDDVVVSLSQVILHNPH